MRYVSHFGRLYRVTERDYKKILEKAEEIGISNYKADADGSEYSFDEWYLDFLKQKKCLGFIDFDFQF